MCFGVGICAPRAQTMRGDSPSFYTLLLILFLECIVNGRIPDEVRLAIAKAIKWFGSVEIDTQFEPTFREQQDYGRGAEIQAS